VASEDMPLRGRITGTMEERALLAAHLREFVVQVGDEAPLWSTVTRTLNILIPARVPMSMWPDLVNEAKAMTLERAGRTRRDLSNASRTDDLLIGVPYYLNILQQLVGLPPGSNE